MSKDSDITQCFNAQKKTNTAKASFIKNKGKISFTHKDEGIYGEFMNTCQLRAWQYAIQKHGINLSKIVDVGCSYGSWGENYRTLGFKKIIGIDVNEAVLERAKIVFDEVYLQEGARLSEIIQDAPTISANSVLIHILEEQENIKFLRGLAEAVSVDGFVIFSAYNCRYYMDSQRKEYIGDNSCCRYVESYRKFAEEAGLQIIDEIGAMIDPWGIPSLEYTAYVDRLREDRNFFKIFVDLADQLRGLSIEPFSEILFVARRKKTERTPRILHIGNIANNAYLNASILNRSGYDCDVLVYDYYHIMGCPEWEDSDFKGRVDEFAPDWWSVDLAGFHRPGWFAQGPTYLALKYLLVRRDPNSSEFKKLIWWHILGLARNFASLPRYSGLKLFYRSNLKFWSAFKILVCRIKNLFLKIILKLSYLFFTSSIIVNITRFLLTSEYKAKLYKYVYSFRKKSFVPSQQNNVENFEELINKFHRNFPDRIDCLTDEDLLHFKYNLPLFAKLFEQYDLIHCYGTDPIWPMLAGNRPWVAFEHSTIRHLPFQNSAMGRLTALAYNQADTVIITNCDCRIAAEKLNCFPYIFVPHPLNERWIEPGIGQELRKSLLAELDSDFLCFHPPRQHWEPWRDLVSNKYETDPSWYKANDIFYEGFARFVQDIAPRAAIICVEWGQKVTESKLLLDKLGIGRVKWIEPQHSRSMLRYIDAADILVDQFWVGAFGTTMPKGMPLGKPAMSYIDPKLHEWCMEEIPPILNAQTPDEVFLLLKRGYEDRDWLVNIGKNGKEWYYKYHSNDIIFKSLDKIYRDICKK